MSNQTFNYKNYKIAAVITTIIAFVIIILSFHFGKSELFLLLNNDLGKIGDFVFNYGTHAGDGLLWVVGVIAILFKRKRHLFPLLISTIIFSTIITQIGKQLILPDELRPSEAIKNKSLGINLYDDLTSINGVKVVSYYDIFKEINKIKKGDNVIATYMRGGKEDTLHIMMEKPVNIHLVKGVDVHSFSSFPSGHTATAFCFALLIVLFIQSTGLAMVCVVAALFTGYTRIYLGQHYPLDVAGGMIVAVLSVTISIFIQRYFDNLRRKRAD